VQQADLDDNGGGDGDIDNTATVSSEELDDEESSTETPVDQNPAIDLEKTVLSVTGGHADHVGDIVKYQISIENTGNVTLTGIDIVDTVEGHAPDEEDPVYQSGDTDGDDALDVGETWLYTYEHTLTADDLADNNESNGGDGDLDNTATVTTDQDATDTDTVSIDLGPGVRTPGFWAQKTWQTFWDGKDNQPKQAGTDGFADGDITAYADPNGLVDSDGNGSLDQRGLLLGDFDLNGIQNGDENVLFVSTADALRLLNASQKEQGDARYILGRDVVATWLNYLSGNALDDADTYLQQAINWLDDQSRTGSNNDGRLVLTGSPNDFSADKVATSSADWTVGITGVNTISASQLHSGLDHYNNTGSV
jgi:hypothetical protein